MWRAKEYSQRDFWPRYFEIRVNFCGARWARAREIARGRKGEIVEIFVVFFSAAARLTLELVNRGHLETPQFSWLCIANYSSHLSSFRPYCVRLVSVLLTLLNTGALALLCVCVCFFLFRICIALIIVIMIFVFLYECPCPGAHQLPMCLWLRLWRRVCVRERARVIFHSNHQSKVSILLIGKKHNSTNSLILPL